MILCNPQLFVLTGGPGSGKTTLLEELARRGYPYAPEVAREIIREQVAAGGNALPWGDREAYTRLMVEGSIESFRRNTPSSGPWLSDRGIPDSLCYARLIGLGDIGYIQDACQSYRYAPTVFVAPPWEEIYRTDAERRQDFDEARHTFAVMVDVYRDCGYELAELPKADPAARAEFVLEHMRVSSGTRAKESERQ